MEAIVNTQSYFTVPQLAKRWGVSQMKIGIWIRDGDLEAIDVSQRSGEGRARWRVKPEAVADFESKRSSSASKKEPDQAGDHAPRRRSRARTYA